MAWPVTASRTVYANRWITVTEDDVVTPDGGAGLYGVVTINNAAVFVVALTDADEVVLVELDRHTVGPSIEVVSGGSDGEDPLRAAQRELLEETGLTADSWQAIGRMDALNGICRAPEHVFLARGLHAAHDADADQREEGITAVRRLPIPEVLAMVQDGRIRDGESVAALMFALLALGRVS
jgi:8-oxo-dGTP pyrophosphatase MutT (NUDIX family)